MIQYFFYFFFKPNNIINHLQTVHNLPFAINLRKHDLPETRYGTHKTDQICYKRSETRPPVHLALPSETIKANANAEENKQTVIFLLYVSPNLATTLPTPCAQAHSESVVCHIASHPYEI